MNKMPIRQLVLCALFAALTAVCAQIQIPLPPVPITLQLLPVLLCAALMAKQYAVLTTAVYMLMGLIGLPVFAGMAGGAAKLFGVTGGYIIGFLPCALVTAFMIEKLGRSWWVQVLSMVVGVLVCYAFGTAWFMVTKGTGLWASLSMCVIPFLPGDAAKIVLAVILSLRLYTPMKRVLQG